MFLWSLYFVLVIQWIIGDVFEDYDVVWVGQGQGWEYEVFVYVGNQVEGYVGIVWLVFEVMYISQGQGMLWFVEGRLGGIVFEEFDYFVFVGGQDYQVMLFGKYFQFGYVGILDQDFVVVCFYLFQLG